MTDIIDLLKSEGEGCICSAYGPTECGCEAEWGYYHINDGIKEIERLREVIAKLRSAVLDTGPHPEHHAQVMQRHEREWPTLWAAIKDLIEARNE